MSEEVVAFPERSFFARKLPLLKLSTYQAKFLCEGIGTFIFVLTIGLAEMNVGSAGIDGKKHTRNLAPIAVGFMLCVLVFTFGYISGGHFNPAVTFAVLLIRGVRIEEAVAYWIGQLIGAFVGAGVAVVLQGSTRYFPAPMVAKNAAENVFTGFIAEMIFTGTLVTVVLHVACSRQRNQHYYGLAIGMCLLAALYSVGSVTGGSFNPAVATSLQLMKCIVSAYCIPLMHLWLYWAAPAAGALLASLLFKMTHPAPVETEEEKREKQQQQSARSLYEAILANDCAMVVVCCGEDQCSVGSTSQSLHPLLPRNWCNNSHYSRSNSSISSLFIAKRRLVTTPECAPLKFHKTSNSNINSSNNDENKENSRSTPKCIGPEKAEPWESRFSAFENHLAAGSDLPPLIRCLQTHVDALSQNGVFKFSVDDEKHVNSEDGLSVHSASSSSSLSSSTHLSDNVESRTPIRRPLSSGSLISSSSEVDGVEDTLSSIPPENTQQSCISGSAASMRASRAVASALLFSVESDVAQREATQLFLSPAVSDIRAQTLASLGMVIRSNAHSPRIPRTIIRNEPLPIVDRKPSMHTFDKTSCTFVPDLLCDRVAASLARRQLQSGSSTDAMEILRYAPHSSATTAVDIELYARELQWEKALGALLKEEPSTWQEPNISAVIRSLYHTAHKRRDVVGESVAVEQQPEAVSCSDAPSTSRSAYDTATSSLWETALNTFQTAVCTHRGDTYDFVRNSGTVAAGESSMHLPCNVWQSIAPVNDLLGILGVHNKWRAACSVIDTYLIPSVSNESGLAQSDTPNKNISNGSSSGTNGIAERVRMQSIRSNQRDKEDVNGFHDDALDFYDFVENTSNPEKSRSDRMNAARISTYVTDWQQKHHSQSSIYTIQDRESTVPVRNRFPPANAVTVSMMCRALRDQWALALKYVALLASRDSVAIEGDAETTCQVLRAYTKGNRWMEAADLLQRWYNASGMRNVSSSSSSSSSASSNHVSGSVLRSRSRNPTELRPEVCLELLYQFQRARRPELTSHILQQHLLSKHHNPDVLSRAHNSMLQCAESLPECKHWMRIMEQKTVSLENESVAHLVEIHARAGEWEKSLSYLEELLHDNHRRYYHVPSTRIHDTVQYALLCAASTTGENHSASTSPSQLLQSSQTGPSWEVSISLFSQMCERNVPVSQIAFQSAVKLCFSQGAGNQAQKLFSLMVKLGVHR